MQEKITHFPDRKKLRIFHTHLVWLRHWLSISVTFWATLFIFIASGSISLFLLFSLIDVQFVKCKLWHSPNVYSRSYMYNVVDFRSTQTPLSGRVGLPITEFFQL